MATKRTDSELVGLEQQAEQLAQGRKERVTSAHLLAAIAALEGGASALLRDRGLGAESLLRAARSATDDDAQPLRRATQGARAVADRMRAPEPGALHLLISLLSDRRSAAYRALDQCGVDVHRLRLAAMNQALGLLGRSPIPGRAGSETRVRANQAQSGGRPNGARSRPVPRRRAEVVSPEDLRDRRRAGRNLARKGAAVPAPMPATPPTPAAAPARPEPRTELGRRFELNPKRFPLLSRFGINLSSAAARGELDRVVCRDAEVERVIDVLCKRQANNPCLVGPSGVGKTCVVHALAQRMAGSGEPLGMEPKIVVELGATALVAGTGVRGGLAQRMQALCREIELAEGRLLIFFDEVHQLFLGDGGEELSSEFKLAVSQGRLPCVGATTREEYARSIELDPALARRFSVVDIDEPSREDAFLVLEALAPRFEAHHGVKYSEASLALSIAWSVQYLPGRALPDKAVSILDLAGARTRRRGRPDVTPEQVAEVVSELCSVPAERLLRSDAERMLNLEQALATRVVGHSENLKAVARSVRRNAAGLGGKRPIGTFLLLGPTGVGKTETAKALAEALFFSDQALTRIDLSEYSEPHAVARLFGAPPGYVGHEAGGQLTEAVRRRPYQVILLDEFEKAHPEVLQSFLAVFDEGRMTDGRGRVVDFSHTLIVMTSNLGANDAGPQRALGFSRPAGGATSEYQERVVRRVREALAPELFNRIDEVLVFAPLVQAEVTEIAQRSLARLSARLLEGRGVRVEFDPSVVEYLLAAGGVDLKLGARPMQRTISRLIEAPLAELLLAEEVNAGDRFYVCARAGKVTIERGPSERTPSEGRATERAPAERMSSDRVSGERVTPKRRAS
jgi:ATP-dependent Clp protease ATP-binding subunit ClpC